MWTKKAYIEVATIIRNSGASKAVQRKLGQDFGRMFQQDNPNFSQSRWEEAIKQGLIRQRANAKPRAL
jgi:hypothetical protein